MRVLLVEYLTTAAPDDQTSDLAIEGWAIVEAAARVLAAEPNVEVWIAFNERMTHLTSPVGVHRLIISHPLHRGFPIAEFDGVILVAPEIDGIAFEWSRRLEELGAKLLSPPSWFVAWAADKIGVAQSLPEISPPTILLDSGDPPAGLGDVLVVKPRDGVGGTFTAVVDRSLLGTAVEKIRERGCKRPLIVQPLVKGKAISVAVVGRRNRPAIVLPAAEQSVEFTADGDAADVRWASYRGGKLPIRVPHERIATLVSLLWNKLQPFDGWFGVDCILTDDGRDAIVDVNPRLTTSILGYSRLWPGPCARLLLGRESNEDRRALMSTGVRTCLFDVAGGVEVVD